MRTNNLFNEPLPIEQHNYCLAFLCYPFDYQRTIELLVLALRNNAYHAPSLALLGQVYFEQLGDLVNAEKYFKKSIQADFNYLLAHEFYIEFLIFKKDLESLLIAYENIKNVRGVSEVYLEILNARILELQGNELQALSALNYAFSISSTDKLDLEVSIHLDRIREKLDCLTKNLQTYNALFYVTRTI